MPRGDKEALKEYSFRCPPLPEQKAIASVLSSLDDKIDLLHRQNKTLEAMAETLFRQWFVEEADDSWDEQKLGHITKVGIGRTPPRKQFHWFSNNPSDITWISIKDMGENGVYSFNSSEYLTNDAIKEFNIPMIPENTVLLSFKMTLGRVSITTETMTSNEAIAHFILPVDSPISKEYLYLHLKTFPYQILGSTSSIVTSINSTMIRNIPVLVPDKARMEDFKKISEDWFNKIFQNQKQLSVLEDIRDSLLPKLLSGEVKIEI
jgi:type I restriction enzyme S subunit